MRRCVVLAGADIHSYDRIRSMLRPEDFIICCDSGLKHRTALGIEPDLIVGDFDSCDNPLLPIETLVLPTIKDDTDSAFAVKEAIHRGFEEFLLLGVVGGRLDHTIGNVSLLNMLHEAGKKAILLDDFSEMEIVSKTPVFIPASFSFFSLLNISGIARGITIKNAKYPLTNAEITCNYQYGISNEVLPGTTAEVAVCEGKLLLIKIF